jgi:hypothetical protein
LLLRHKSELHADQRPQFWQKICTCTGFFFFSLVWFLSTIRRCDSHRAKKVAKPAYSVLLCTRPIGCRRLSARVAAHRVLQHRLGYFSKRTEVCP